MLKRRTLIFLILLVFITGCQNGSEKTAEGAYVGGAQGLGLSFVDNEPPLRVLDADSDEFLITLLLDNVGEYDVGQGGVRVTLGGIDQKEFQIKDMTKRNENLIRGISKEREEIIAGDIEELTYNARYKSDLNADFSTIISANVCYNYGTRSLTSLCLRRDSSVRPREGDSCTIDEAKPIENSGAPIQVSNVFERPVGKNAVRITFDIENVGKRGTSSGFGGFSGLRGGTASADASIGDVYQAGAFNQVCYGDEDKKNKVNTEVVGTGGIKFKCDKLSGGNKGVVRLVENKVTISCETDTKGLQEIAFASPVNINLDYVYRESISADIIVEDAG